MHVRGGAALTLARAKALHGLPYRFYSRGDAFAQARARPAARRFMGAEALRPRGCRGGERLGGGVGKSTEPISWPVILMSPRRAQPEHLFPDTKKS